MKIFRKYQLLSLTVFVILGASLMGISTAKAETWEGVEVGNYQTKFYWDRGNIIASHKVRTGNEVSCPGIDEVRDAVKSSSANTSRERLESEREKINRTLKDCARKAFGGKLPQSIENVGPKDTYIETRGNKGILGVAEIKTGDGSISCRYYDKAIGDTFACRTFAYQSRITSFNSMIVDRAKDEVLYEARNVPQILDTYDAIIAVRNNTIVDFQMTSSGEESITFANWGNNRNVIGDPDKTWQENFFYHEVNQQFDDVKNKYKEQCLKTTAKASAADCSSDKSDQAFSQIWLKCMVPSGGPEESIENANACLKVNAGVMLDNYAYSRNIPTNEAINSAQPNSCGIQPAGWIVCSTMRFLGLMGDGMFSIIKNMLEIKPLDNNVASITAAKNAWKVFVSIANVIFVIFFLVVIISQVSGYGVATYGIKRLMPKLVIAIILVNLSFYLSQIMVDISNILGASLHEVMKIINNSVTSNANLILSTDYEDRSSYSFGSMIESLVAPSAIGGAAVAGVAAFAYSLLPILLSVILSLLFFVVTLFIRYSLVILLMIVSPLAMIALTLPNTKNLFQKWKNMFIGLLMLYPLTSLMFGMATLAANVILQTANDSNAQTLKIFAVAIQVLPLISVPYLTRRAQQVSARFDLGQIGQLGKKSRGVVEKSAEKMQQRYRDQYTAAAYQNKTFKYDPFALYTRSKGKSDVVKAQRSRMEAKYTRDYISARASDDKEYQSPLDKLRNAQSGMTQGEKFRRQAVGSSSVSQARLRQHTQNILIDKDFKDKIQATKVEFTQGNYTPAQIMDRISGSKGRQNLPDQAEADVIAAIESLIYMHDVKGDDQALDCIDQILNNYNFSTRQQFLIEQDLSKSSSPILNSRVVVQSAQSSVENSDSVYIQSIQSGEYTEEIINKMRPQNLAAIQRSYNNYVRQNGIDPSTSKDSVVMNYRQMQQAARRAYANPSLYTERIGDGSHLDEFARGVEIKDK